MTLSYRRFGCFLGILLLEGLTLPRLAAAQVPPPAPAPQLGHPPPAQMAAAQPSTGQVAPGDPASPPPDAAGVHLHDKTYVRIALGGGTLKTSASTDPDVGMTLDTSGAGPSFQLAVGGTPAPGLVIGGMYVFQQSTKPSFTLSGRISGSGDATNNVVFGVLGPVVDWFPIPTQGFHVGGMIGLSILSVADSGGGLKDDTTEHGFGGAVQVGYDFWVAEQWSIGLLGQFVGGKASSDAQGGVTEKDNVTSFGLLLSALYH